MSEHIEVSGGKRASKSAQMWDEAQAKADTGMAVLWVQQSGMIWVQPRLEAVDAVLARLEASC